MLIINKYRKERPFPKVLLENVLYWLRYYRLYYKNNKTVKTAVFYPQYPSKRAVLYKIFGVLGYNRTNNLNTHYDVVINWQDATFRTRYAELEKIADNQRVINYNCMDISKRNVDRIHHDVFGYSTSVDPRTEHAKCVKKSDFNAQHDGVIIETPVKEAEEGFIYQKIINNKYDDTIVEDIRTPVFGDEIPLVYLKYKPVDKRFGSFLTGHHAIKETSIKEPDEVFSNKELQQVKAFTKAIGMDYGELDILRDRDDGKIYIIDVNNTPTGPSHLPKNTEKDVLTKLAQTFSNVFLKGISINSFLSKNKYNE